MLQQFFWTFLLGPPAALLPETWRRALPGADRVHWERAGMISGLVELTAAVFAMAYWYFHTMMPMISSGTEAALLGKFKQGATEFQIGGAALAVFATHSVTWVFAYAFAEGAVRLFGAAFTEEVLGLFPLFLIERAIFLVRHREQIRSDEDLRRNLNSLVEGVRHQTIAARRPQLCDELHYSTEAGDEFLEIWASRMKDNWDPPKVTHVDDTYYRLEQSWVEKDAERPFRYRLRRLEAGVPGRNVLIYKTGKSVVKF